jgi:hypothetical protein
MKMLLVIWFGLLGLMSVARAEDKIDCSAKPPGGTENMSAWLAYKSECEMDCKNTLAIYCEKHAHGGHGHPVDILTEERAVQAREKARMAKEKREELARLRRERDERETRIEAIVKRSPMRIERR